MIKAGNSSIFMREIIITSICKEIKLTTVFEVWSWLKFKNLRMALGMALEFYTSVGANSYVCRNYKEKTVRGGRFFLPSSILNRVKESTFLFS